MRMGPNLEGPSLLQSKKWSICLSVHDIPMTNRCITQKHIASTISISEGK
jgi:hypothetical protein